MTQEKLPHIEPSRHSTTEVDGFLHQVEADLDVDKGAGSPAIKPSTALGDDGKPDNDNPKNPRA
jgi:hypothetical protein